MKHPNLHFDPGKEREELVRFNENVTYFCEPNTMILADTYEFDLMCVNSSSDGTTSADGRFVSDFLINSAILPTPQLSDCKESEFTSQFGSTADFNCKIINLLP